MAEPTPPAESLNPFDGASVEKAALDANRPRNPDGTFKSPESDTPATVTPPSAPAPPAIDTYRERLLAEAQDIGYDPSELEGVNTPSLANILRKHYQQHAAANARYEQLLASDRQRQPYQDVPATPTPAPADDIQLEEDRWEPELARAIKLLNDDRKALKEELTHLKSQLGEVNQRSVQQAVRSNADMVDAAFESLGDGYERIIGKGAGRDMGREQEAEFKRRVAILNEAGIDVARQLPSMGQLKTKIKQAATLLFPQATAAASDPYAAAQRGQTPVPPQANGKPTPDEWASAGLARPTDRTVLEQPGREAAIRALSAKMRDGGSTGGDGNFRV